MFNRSEYVSFWIGCAKVGVTCALINTNSTGKTLIHSVNTAFETSSTKILVIDDDLLPLVKNDLDELKKNGVSVYLWNDLQSIHLSKQSIERPPKNLRSSIKERDPLILIFTSGTTGLPKASRISHSRFVIATFVYPALGSLTTKDRIYSPLPLYHSAAGMLGVGGSLRSGACMVLRKKFSARSFVPDCIKYKCTSMQYIGELCRYLTSTTSETPEELSKLTLKSAFGNGLRPDIWTKFKDKYRINRIIEFYASTEGNLGLFNSTNRVGALGFVPRIADFIYPINIIKTDPIDKTVPYRNSKGYCEVCKADEIGLLVGKVDNNRIDRRFDGYTDKQATNKKLITNVFTNNDVYFNTGDLLYRDYLGFFYWSDRTGDTFRWKGENVSTTQISEIITSNLKQFTDVSIYGVEVPNSDGKAGMAAVCLSNNVKINDVDWNEVYDNISTNIPSYARPLFIRIQKQMATTGTFKYVKGDLVKEGFNPDQVGGDPLFFLSVKDKKIIPLTKEIYNDIISNKILL
eukprot:gene20836-27004_t